MAVSVLLLVNNSSEAAAPGYADGLSRLTREGEISGFRAIYVTDSRLSDGEHLAQISRSREDIVLAISIKDHLPDPDRLDRALAGRPVIYWEGDAWGRGKEIPSAMAYWIARAQRVFTVAGHPQSDTMYALGARSVHLTCHTYDQVLFRPPPHTATPNYLVVQVGSNLMRFPPLGGLPGSRDRFALAALLRSKYRSSFLLGGRGWPAILKAEQVHHNQQMKFVQSARVLANWEHFPSYANYFSDRLPITMLAGTPQVTNSAPALDWLTVVPGAVNFVKSPRGVLQAVDRLLAMPGEELSEIGRLARDWAAGRLSHVEALRHMLRSEIPTISPPPALPWDRWVQPVQPQ